MGNGVVIVAGGRGSRLGGSGGPKQYQDLAGRPLLQRTLDCFANEPEIDVIQVVIHPDDTETYHQKIIHHPKLLPPVFGGKTRQESCHAGIRALQDTVCEKVLIHDAARPFVSSQLVQHVLKGIKPGVCALPACPVSETLKKVTDEGYVSQTVDREQLYLAQTPQGFMQDDILEAHQAAQVAGNNEFTDDAAVAEWHGMQVVIVPGDRDNFKITTAMDLQSANMKMKATNANIHDIRTGSGYDVHAFGKGDGVTLCGVRIPHDRSLIGHSDADVGLHALTDALLGAMGAGDIGLHFPPDDERWKGADSEQFLAHAAGLVLRAGGRINNLDVTIVCEEPKIGPHREEMRQRISGILNLDVGRVSVKATTHERIGTLGRREGIAAIAVATVAVPLVDGEEDG